MVKLAYENAFFKNICSNVFDFVRKILPPKKKNMKEKRKPSSSLRILAIKVTFCFFEVFGSHYLQNETICDFVGDVTASGD